MCGGGGGGLKYKAKVGENILKQVFLDSKILTLSSNELAFLSNITLFDFYTCFILFSTSIRRNYEKSVQKKFCVRLHKTTVNASIFTPEILGIN